MINRVVRSLALAITVAAFTTPLLSAQGVEINPYFGGVWPDSSAVGELKTNALWGLRAGFQLDPSFALEANFGYLNHFEVKGTDPKSRGILWEFAPTYTFAARDWALPSSFKPHLNVGLGAITTRLKDPDKFTYNVFDNMQFLGAPAQTRVRSIEMSSGDTFFTVSAGGGIKVGQGPIAFRGDLRARMLPNYYRSSPIWMEAAVGISFILGNRP
jgi:hypothetical protein